jgi:hypothetical protein
MTFVFAPKNNMKNVNDKASGQNTQSPGPMVIHFLILKSLFVTEILIFLVHR